MAKKTLILESFSKVLKKSIIKEGKEPKRFFFVVDLDKRGDFQAHVTDDRGEEVFSIDGGDDLLNIIDDGFMKNRDDLDGLQAHLIDMGIMKDGDELTDDELDLEDDDYDEEEDIDEASASSDDLEYINSHREATGHEPFEKLSPKEIKKHLDLIDANAENGNDPWAEEDVD